MIIPSGSKIGLVMACQHPCTAVTEWPEQEPGESAEIGNDTHGALETVALGEAPAKLSSDKARAAYLRGREILDALMDAGESWMLVPELAIAYHVETSTARPLKKAHHRDYSDLRTGEIPATLDLVGARRGDLLVLDWKTGLKIEHDGRTTWQMRFCGLAAARMFGASDVRVTLAYIGDSYQGTPSVLLDAWDLDEAAQEPRDLWRKIHAGPQPPKPGPHCTRDYCPLIGQCEATRAALASLAPTPIERVTRENAAKAWELLPRAEAALKAVKAEILKLASREPKSEAKRS